MVAGYIQFLLIYGVCGSREIAAGFLGSHNSRAKVITGAVMVYNGRKVIVGYAGMRSGCSVGCYGLEKDSPPGGESSFLRRKKSLPGFKVYCNFNRSFLIGGSRSDLSNENNNNWGW